MLRLVEQHRSELAALCRQYEVRRLELFGSAARGEFVPESSDLDFLVVYQRPGKVNAADRYLGLLTDLRQLFGTRIDLVDVTAHTNPYFMAGALKDRVMLYAA